MFTIAITHRRKRCIGATESKPRVKKVRILLMGEFSHVPANSRSGVDGSTMPASARSQARPLCWRTVRSVFVQYERAIDFLG